jgi:hypothetical protein
MSKTDSTPFIYLIEHISVKVYKPSVDSVRSNDDDLIWEIQPARMRLVVDGEIRHETTGSWQDVKAPLGIGPCFGSVVVVRAFVVE